MAEPPWGPLHSWRLRLAAGTRRCDERSELSRGWHSFSRRPEKWKREGFRSEKRRCIALTPLLTGKERLMLGQ